MGWIILGNCALNKEWFTGTSHGGLSCQEHRTLRLISKYRQWWDKCWGKQIKIRSHPCFEECSECRAGRTEKEKQWHLYFSIASTNFWEHIRTFPSLSRLSEYPCKLKELSLDPQQLQNLWSWWCILLILVWGIRVRGRYNLVIQSFQPKQQTIGPVRDPASKKKWTEIAEDSKVDPWSSYAYAPIYTYIYITAHIHTQKLD